ncbi:MAG: hypothetical protein F6K39_30305 [Okeania sp. SIO3B3]|nr:hypothetical protein [Okeania sp. SIO3B3]
MLPDDREEELTGQLKVAEKHIKRLENRIKYAEENISFIFFLLKLFMIVACVLWIVGQIFSLKTSATSFSFQPNIDINIDIQHLHTHN